MGVEKENIFIINNGDVVDIQDEVARQTRSIQSGDLFVDGMGIGDVGNIVLRDRKLLSEEGMLVIVVTVNKTDGRLVSDPDTISRGFVYSRDAEELMNEVNNLVIKTVQKLQNANGNKRNLVRQTIKKSTESLLYTRTKRRPMILPIIIEV